MSEKNLTELPWKALVTKKKLKDTELTKALAAYNKADEDDYDARLSALDSIEKAATTLKKEHKADAEITGHLTDVLAEAGKSRKAIETEKKQVESDDDEEGGADPKVIKKRMVSLLNQVKTKAPDEPQLGFMACLAGPETAVLLTQRVGGSPKKGLLAMLPNASGPKFVQGECRWEENTHTFVLETIPGGLSKKLSKAIFTETGVKYKVRVRKPDGSGLVDSDTEADPDAPVESTGTPPPPAPPNIAAPGQAEFMAQFRTLKPDLDKVIAGKPPIAGQVTTLFQKASDLARARNFMEANVVLKELAGLVKTGLEQLSPPETGGLEDTFKKRLATLVPKIKEAIAANGPGAAELRLRSSEAGALAKQGNYAGGTAVLDQIEKLLGGPGAGGTPQTEPTSTPPPTTPKTPEPTTPPKGKDDQSKYDEQFAALESKYLDALKGTAGNPEGEKLAARLKTIWAFATAQAEAGSHARALAAFQRIESENLFDAITKTKPSQEPKSGQEPQSKNGLVAKRKFLLTRWKQIPPLLTAELEALKKQIATDVPDDDVSDLTARMDRYMETLLSGLQAKIDQGLNSGDMSIVKGIKDEYEGDELIQHLIANPFISGAKFDSVVRSALEEIETNLAA